MALTAEENCARRMISQSNHHANTNTPMGEGWGGTILGTEVAVAPRPEVAQLLRRGHHYYKWHVTPTHLP
ncbi:hypothetical protein GDO78_015605 [Eleutherodactylus coqui]|uniref:Uncharacterized protein n=1 Tax=Eleutherodactylus coqui TaxID=57060 RepID=A0A8J6ENV0_ELECQ|nr:hypothetical protein GDO78_015605 [Eleutherodactylus coqui]